MHVVFKMHNLFNVYGAIAHKPQVYIYLVVFKGNELNEWPRPSPILPSLWGETFLEFTEVCDHFVICILWTLNNATQEKVKSSPQWNR